MNNEPNETTKDDPIELRLAIGLLQIARMAMPDSYFFSDSRCELARDTMRRHGFRPETVYD